tara:strand:+ start:458 stop:1036 length:579 start_codon:yes stop_codon:yes gene_type:complete
MINVERVNLDFIPATRDGYVLPIFSDQVEIFQGYNGPYSHFAMNNLKGKLIDDRFAIDFRVSFGTEIIAAKAGTVEGGMLCYDDVYVGGDPEIGLMTRTNFLILKHPDGSKTLYSHIAKFGSVVKRGQEVEQGQPIATTGPSGWIGPTPHLHFEAFTIPNEIMKSRHTFPVRFDNYQGPLEHSELERALGCN